MICISIGEASVEDCLLAIGGAECAEIRLDLLAAGPEAVERIFASHPRLIATCRPGSLAEESRAELLIRAIDSGAAYVDVELEWEGPVRDRVVDRARAAGCRVIVSFHDHETTPESAGLRKIIERSFDRGADAVKVACRVRSDRENARLLGLLDDSRPLIVIGMGDRGRITRIAAPLLGSLWTYAAAFPGKETADGQRDAASLARLLKEWADG
ncbi:MAG: type I 3-dehydroquinate dehydratase [Candidatus Aminicenantales bacterium]